MSETAVLTVCLLSVNAWERGIISGERRGRSGGQQEPVSDNVGDLEGINVFPEQEVVNPPV